MGQPLTTSLTVNFGDYDDQHQILWEEDTEKGTPNEYQTYVRLYPNNVPIRFTTSGTLTNAVNTYDTTEEIVIFSGNSAVGLRYPHAYNVVTSLIGAFFDTDGKPTLAIITFDASRNELNTSKAVYGAVRVSYTVNFTSFLFTYAGGPCPGLTSFPYIPANPITPTSTNTSPYEEAVLVALDPIREAVGSLQLTPPDCDRREFNVNKGDEADNPRIDLMIDPAWPIRLSSTVETPTGKKTVTYLASRTKVRLIPSTNDATVKINRQSAKIKLEQQNLEENVAESILFTGSTSTNIEYQAKSKIAAVGKGIWRDKWGDSFSPSFRGPGDTVTEVDWVNKNTYKNPRQRTVGSDEVAVVDMWGRAIEAFGVVEVSYVYDYDLYDLHLPYDYNRKTFESVYITAVNEKAPDQLEPATLYIQPPPLEGTK